MGNKQQKYLGSKQDNKRSKSAENQKQTSNHNSVYEKVIIPPNDPIKQMQRSQQQSMQMLNNSQLGRTAVTPPPRMGQSKYGGAPSNLILQDQQVGLSINNQYERNDLNRSNLSSIAQRANIGRSQRDIILSQQQHSKLDISDRIEHKRSTSPNGLLPPKEEVSVMLSNIRQKVESQLALQSNLTLNMNDYLNFAMLRSESQQDIQRMNQTGENNSEKLFEKQKLFERTSTVTQFIEKTRKQEYQAMKFIDFNQSVKEKKQTKREQSLENLLKQDFSQLSSNQYGYNNQMRSQSNLQLKEMFGDAESLQGNQKNVIKSNLSERINSSSQGLSNQSIQTRGLQNYIPQSEQNVSLNSYNYPNQQKQQITIEKISNSSQNQELPHFNQIQQSQSTKQISRNNHFQENQQTEFSNPASNNSSPDIAQMRYNTESDKYNINSQQNQQNDFYSESDQRSQRKQWFGQTEQDMQQLNSNQYEENTRSKNIYESPYQQQEWDTQQNKQQQAIPHSQSSVQLSNPKSQFQNNDHSDLRYQNQENTNFIPANPRNQIVNQQNTNNQQENYLKELNEKSQLIQQQIEQLTLQQQLQKQGLQQQQNTQSTRNIRKEIEAALANKFQQPMQQSDIMKHSTNPQQMKESYLTNFDHSLLPYQQNYSQNMQFQKQYQNEEQKPYNTSQMNESYLSRSNVNVYIEKERLQKKGNDIQVYRNVKLSKNKPGNQNNINQSNLIERKGSKVIQINKQGGNTMKNSNLSNNYNNNGNYLQQHLSKVQSQKQIYKPLNISQNQNQGEEYYQIQQIQDQNLFHDVSAINYPTKYHENCDNSFLSNSNILLNDQSLLENYNMTKMHKCDANHDHEKYKTPKQYQNLESHYSPNNLQFYLNKDHKSYSNNQKWVQEKTDIDKTNDANRRVFWPKKPDTEIRSKTKDTQIKQKLTHSNKGFEQGLNDAKKSIALYKNPNDKNSKSTIEIPTINKNQLNESEVNEKKSINMKFDLKSEQLKKKDESQMNHIFTKYMNNMNEGSASDRSHYVQICPREFENAKSQQIKDQNKQSIHQDENSFQNNMKSNFNVQSSNNLPEVGDDQKSKAVYSTIGVSSSNNAFYQPNWIQINKNPNQQSQVAQQNQSMTNHIQEDKFISHHESPQQIYQQEQQSRQQSMSNGQNLLEQKKQTFYQQREYAEQSDSYYLKYPQSQISTEQNEYQVPQRVPANPNKNNNLSQGQFNPNQSNMHNLSTQSGLQRPQYNQNMTELTSEVDSLKRELLI